MPFYYRYYQIADYSIALVKQYRYHTLDGISTTLLVFIFTSRVIHYTRMAAAVDSIYMSPI